MDLHDPFYDLFPRRSFPSIEPGRTALLTIDLQYLDAHEDGWIGRIAEAAGQPEIMRERWDNINGILPNVRRCQDAFREAGFQDFRWLGVSLDPAERSNPFWDDFLENPPVIAFTATR